MFVATQLVGFGASGSPLHPNTKLLANLDENSSTIFKDQRTGSNLSIAGSGVLTSGTTPALTGMDRTLRTTTAVMNFTGPATIDARTDDLTAEVYAYHTGWPSPGIGFGFEKGTGSGGVRMYSDARDIYFYASGNVASSFTALTNSAWQHWCMMRASGVWYGFIDGVQKMTWTETGTPFDGSDKVELGYRHSGGGGSDHYFSSWRVSNRAVYSTSGFTAPTLPFTE